MIMKKNKNTLPILLPSKWFLRRFFRLFYSITNFTKASILSLIVLLAILVLLSQMEQAYTMLLRMAEDERVSLFLCFVMVNVLAIGFSHFPIYTYFAGNLNNSRRSVTWKKSKPFKFPPLSWINVYVYTNKPFSESGYVPDLWANILRHSLGLVIYFIWFYFIYSAFQPNLIHLTGYWFGYECIIYSSWSIPLVTYAAFTLKLNPVNSETDERKTLYKSIGWFSAVFWILSVVFLFITLFHRDLFSLEGLTLLLVTTFCMMMHYVFYRLARTRKCHIVRLLKNDGLEIMSRFVSRITWFSNPSAFLAFMITAFIFSFLYIIYLNIAALNSYPLPNGLLIVLLYVYFYFYLISAIGKYYFVQFAVAEEEKKKNNVSPLDSLVFRLLTGSLIVFTASFILGFFTESNQNELEIRPLKTSATHTHIDTFSVQFKPTKDTIFYVCSHGGGLKANAWTLNVLNEIDGLSKGEFMSNTVAFSGASEGSLGLALYGTILGENKNQLHKVAPTIQKIQCDNYASGDVALLFGIDFIRSLYPLNCIVKSNNRSDMSMLKYQQNIKGDKNPILDPTDFRTFWGTKKYRAKNLPALIMNTASTRGKRGIFFSLKTNNFDAIFPFAENLGDLRSHFNSPSALSFYQAVSTTNRFPIFSPAAKIKGVGHFIDAGAIDNSGLLGCWDLYLYLRMKDQFKNKAVVFVEIINGKSNYVEHVLKNFIDENPKLKILLDEDEKSSILANLETGLNLNKIPGYLQQFMKNYSKLREELHYHQIFLPHKISIQDVEHVLKAEIQDSKFKTRLNSYLKAHNQLILKATDNRDPNNLRWQYYEPVLSRQLSKSNIKYYQVMRKHPLSNIPSIKKYF